MCCPRKRRFLMKEKRPIVEDPFLLNSIVYCATEKLFLLKISALQIKKRYELILYIFLVISLTSCQNALFSLFFWSKPITIFILRLGIPLFFGLNSIKFFRGNYLLCRLLTSIVMNSGK